MLRDVILAAWAKVKEDGTVRHVYKHHNRQLNVHTYHFAVYRGENEYEAIIYADGAVLYKNNRIEYLED